MGEGNKSVDQNLHGLSDAVINEHLTPLLNYVVM